jgi:hypothetical protein
MERDQSHNTSIHNTSFHDNSIRINHVEYGKIDEHRMLLGLHLPHEIDQASLVIGMHGGK